MGRRRPRLRLALIVGAFVLALLPNFGSPAVASPRFSGHIIGTEVSRPWPTHDGKGLTTPDGRAAGLANAGSTGGPTLLYTSDTIDAGQVFSHVGVHWIAARGEEESIYPEVRTSSDGVTWTSWTSVHEDEDMTNEYPDEHYAAPLESDAARYAQYRVWLTSGDPNAIAKVSLTFIDATDLNAGPLARLFDDIQGAVADMFTGSVASAATTTRILSRQDWGADESLMDWPPKYVPVKKFVVHHTVTSDGGSNIPAAIRSIYYYHAVTRGWGDIGYNYLVDKNGNIWTGRQGGDNTVGGHAYGWNDGSIGIAAIGDYSIAQPSPALQQGLAKIIAIKSAQLGIQPYGADVFTHQEQAPDGTWVKITSSPPNVQGHRDCNYILSQHGGQTSCPGNGIYNLLPAIRTLAQTEVGEGFADMPYIDAQMPHAAFPGAVIQVPVAVVNRGKTPIPAGTLVSYQILKNGAVVQGQGGRTVLPAALGPGGAATVTVPFTTPSIGSYVVRWDLQTGGQWWNLAKGTPVRDVWFNAADWSVEWNKDNVPIAWVAGEIKMITVTFTNDGGRAWTTGATDPTGAVRLGYKWVSNATGNTFPGPQKFDLPSAVQPGGSVTMTIPVKAPVYPTNYTMYLDLYKGNEFAFSDRGVAPDDTPTGVSVDFKATYTVGTLPTWNSGGTAIVPVTITNTGRGTLPITNSYPVELGYHWYTATGTTVLWDGLRTKLPADLLSGQSVQLQAQVQAPPDGGAYQLRFDLVQEGVAWFSQKGLAMGGVTTAVAGPFVPSYGATYQPQVTTLALPGSTATVPIAVTNGSNFAWPNSGSHPIDLSYHWVDGSGNTVTWDGLRTTLPAPVVPGASANLQAAIQFPSAAGTYTLRWDMVEEGVTWFSGKNVPTFDQKVTLGSTPPPPAGSGASLIVTGTPASMAPGATVSFGVTVQNISSSDWGANVNLSYHWYDAGGNVVTWDGLRTSLAGMKVNEARNVTAQVAAPTTPGTYTLKYDVVQEGVAWFSSQGMTMPARTVVVAVNAYGATYAPALTTVTGNVNDTVYFPVTITNNGALTWQPGEVNIGYHLLAESGNLYVWDGKRTALTAPVPQGGSVTVNMRVLLAPRAGTFTIRIDMVQEGVTWFSDRGVQPGSLTLVVQ